MKLGIDFIDRLRAKGFELTKDQDFAEYLGINFKRDDDNGTITMTQPGLIKKIVEATKLEGCTPKHTSAATALTATLTPSIKTDNLTSAPCSWSPALPV